jgi:hypothetical protein
VVRVEEDARQRSRDHGEPAPARLQPHGAKRRRRTMAHAVQSCPDGGQGQLALDKQNGKPHSADQHCDTRWRQGTESQPPHSRAHPDTRARAKQYHRCTRAAPEVRRAAEIWRQTRPFPTLVNDNAEAFVGFGPKNGGIVKFRVKIARPKHTSFVASLILAALVSAGGAVPANAGNGQRDALNTSGLAPTAALAEASIYWGATFDGSPDDATRIDAFERAVGKRTSIVQWGAPWSRRGRMLDFQTSYFDTVRARGSIPMLDWVCMDGYNWGKDYGNVWLTFNEVFNGNRLQGVFDTYAQLLAVAPTKPVMIGETASSENGGSKADWITDMLEVELPINFPQIKAVIWFDTNAGDPVLSWPLRSSEAALRAFSSGISSPIYPDNAYATLDVSPIPPPEYLVPTVG